MAFQVFTAPPNPGSLQADGVYPVLLAPTANPPIGPSTSLSGICGSATWGKLNTLLPASDQTTLYDAVGVQTLAAHNVSTEALTYFDQASQLLIVRVSDGTDTAAQIDLVDNTGFATGTMVISGTPGTNQTISAVLVNGSNSPITAGPYAIQNSDTPTTIAAALTSIINATTALNGPSAFLRPAVNTAGSIAYTALNSGVGGNSITIQAVVTGSGITATPSSITPLSGGAVPGILAILTAVCTGSRPNTATAYVSQSATYTTTSPIFRIQLQVPYGSVEVFDGIVGYASAGGGYSASTFVTNIVSAINKGLNVNRAPSNYWTATSSTSTGSPLLNTNITPAVLGTSGEAGVTSQTMLGQDGITNRQGMYVFRSSGVAQFILAGNTDATVAGTISAFAESELDFPLLYTSPSGTSTTTAIANKTANNATSIWGGVVMDWANWYDPILGQQRLISPLGYVLGIIASQPAQNSPGNKPRQGLTTIISTERTGTAFSTVEAGQRASAGITYITNQMPRGGGLFGLGNGQNASGIAGQDGINYTRLTNYLTQVIFSALGQYVDELQGTSNTDPTRASAAALLRQIFATYQKQNVIDSYSVTLDNTNNTPVTIAQGIVYAYIIIRYLGTARFWVPSIQAGPTVQIPGLQAVTGSL